MQCDIWDHKKCTMQAQPQRSRGRSVLSGLYPLQSSAPTLSRALSRHKNLPFKISDQLKFFNTKVSLCHDAGRHTGDRLAGVYVTSPTTLILTAALKHTTQRFSASQVSTSPQSHHFKVTLWTNQPSAKSTFTFSPRMSP